MDAIRVHRTGTAPYPARSRPGRQGLQLQGDPRVACRRGIPHTIPERADQIGNRAARRGPARRRRGSLRDCCCAVVSAFESVAAKGDSSVQTGALVGAACVFPSSRGWRRRSGRSATACRPGSRDKHAELLAARVILVENPSTRSFVVAYSPHRPTPQPRRQVGMGLSARRAGRRLHALPYSPGGLWSNSRPMERARGRPPGPSG